MRRVVAAALTLPRTITIRHQWCPRWRPSIRSLSPSASRGCSSMGCPMSNKNSPWRSVKKSRGRYSWTRRFCKLGRGWAKSAKELRPFPKFSSRHLPLRPMWPCRSKQQATWRRRPSYPKGRRTESIRRRRILGAWWQAPSRRLIFMRCPRSSTTGWTKAELAV